MPVLDVPVLLSGYGPVGRAYTAELAARGDELAGAYGVRPYVAGIRRGRSEWRVPEAAPDGPGAVPDDEPDAWRPIGEFGAALDAVRPRVFAQAVPSSAELTEPARAEAAAALRGGVHVATATKSHLLAYWRELHAAAESGGAALRFSGATGAALPAGDIARHSLLGFGCRSIRGCPNGTSTYVLDRLAAGAGLDAAIADAQARGIAEADPSADLSGTDAATKIRLLAGLAWGWDVSAVRVRTVPIDAGTAEMARTAAAAGHRPRAVATARADRPGEVTVEPEAIRPGDPLHALTGPDKAIVFDCGEAGEITVSGGRSSPRGAALALLKDTLSAAVAGR